MLDVLQALLSRPDVPDDVKAYLRANHADPGEQRFRGLFDHMLDAAALHEIVLDATGRPADYRFLAVNQAFTAMTGLAADAVLGRTVREVTPDVEPYWIERYGRVALTGESAEFEAWSVALERHYRVSAFQPLPGQFVAVFHDVTERHRAARRAERLRAALLAMADAPTVQAALERLLAAALDLSGLEFGGIYLVEDGVAVLRHEVGLDPAFAAAVRAMPLDLPMVAAVLAQGQTVCDVTHEPAARELIEAFSLLAIHVGVLRTDEEVLGFVNIGSTTRAEGSRGEMEAFGTLVAEASSVLRRLRAESAAARDRAVLRSVFDAIPDLVFVKDTAGRYLDGNQTWRETVGLEAAEVLGTTGAVLFSPELAARFAEQDQDVLARGERLSFQQRVTHRDGHSMVVDSSKTPVWGPDGSLLGLVGVSRDITASHAAAEALRDREARYRAVIETSHDGFCIADTAGRIIECNDVLRLRSGYSTEELLGRRLADLTPHGALDEAVDRLSEVRTTGSALFETLLQAKDGTVWQAELDLAYVAIDGGRFFAFVRDVTQRKRSEFLMQTRVLLADTAEAANVDELLRLALDRAELLTGSGIGFFHFVDADQEHLTLQMWSTHTLETMCTAEAKGQHYPVSEAGVWTDCLRTRQPVVHNDYAALAHRKGLPEGHAAVSRELVVPVIRDGLVVAVMGVGNKTTDYDAHDVDAVQTVASMVADLALRQRAREEFEQFFQLVPDLVCIAARDGRFHRVNPEWERVLGYTQAELLDRPFLEFVHPDDRAATVAEWEREQSGAATTGFINRYQAKDGSYRWLEWHSATMANDTLVFAAARDITERFVAEEELRNRAALLVQAQRVAQLGHYELDIAAGTWSSSPALNEVLGIEADHAKQLHDWLALVHPDDVDALGAYVRHRVFEQCQSFDREYRIIRPRDGAVRWVHRLGELELDAAGRPARMFGTVQDIAERKRAEEAVRESESRYRYIFEHTPAGIFRLAMPGLQPLLVNAQAAHMLGYATVEQALAEFVSVEHYLDPAEHEAVGAQLLAEGRALNMTRQLRRHDGTVGWFRYSMHLNADGGYIDGVIEDITAAKEAEAALAESENYYRAVFEGGRVVKLLLDPDAGGAIVDANPVACEFYGLPREQLTAMRVSDLNEWPEEQVLATVRACRETELASFEARHRLASGEVRDVQVFSGPVVRGGRALLNAIVFDITDRVRAERLLRAAVEGTAGATGTAFFRGLVRTLADTLGCRLCFVAELAGSELRALACWLDGGMQENVVIARAGTPCDLALRQGSCFVPEHLLERFPQAAALGQCGMDSYGGVCLQDEHGQPMGVLVVAHSGARFDASQAESLLRICAARAATELQRTRTLRELRHLVAAMDQAGEAVMVTDTEGRIEYVNPAFERITGYGRDEVLGERPSLLKSGEHDEAFYHDMWQTILGGQVWAGQLVNRRKDGGLLTEETTVAPVRDEEGEIVRFVAVQRDITREQELEESLRQAQKLEAIGQLAGGVAHDLNNLLTPIMGYAEMVLDELDLADPRHELLAEVVTASHRARDLVKHLLAFGRRQTLLITTVDLNEVIGRFVPLLRRSLREDIELELDLAEPAVPVRADMRQIEQVLLNLAVNAQDAMPGGGRLAIGTATRWITAVETPGPDSLAPGGYALLTVRDTGVGMDASTAARIFEPFFTTKGEHGTGLGLATTFGIVKQHDGDVRVQSRPAAGTEFTIWLPLAEEATSSAVSSAPVAVSRGRETILVAEDEAHVRALTVRMLQHLGYRVLTADSGEGCLALAAEQPVDLLLTDVVMPGLHGPELASRVRALQPGVRLLLASGYARDVLGSDAQLGPADGFIQKPFELRELAQVLRRLLDQPVEPTPPSGGQPAPANP